MCIPQICSHVRHKEGEGSDLKEPEEGKKENDTRGDDDAHKEGVGGGEDEVRHETRAEDRGLQREPIQETFWMEICVLGPRVMSLSAIERREITAGGDDGHQIVHHHRIQSSKGQKILLKWRAKALRAVCEVHKLKVMTGSDLWRQMQKRPRCGELIVWTDPLRVCDV
jgi:hypothetical protein